MLKTGCNGRSRIGRRVHRYHFELRQIPPVTHPLLEQCGIVALHHLKAAPIVRCHPARNVAEAFRRHSSALTKSPVDRYRVIAKVFDDHVKHESNYPRLIPELRRLMRLRPIFIPTVDAVPVPLRRHSTSSSPESLWTLCIGGICEEHEPEQSRAGRPREAGRSGWTGWSGWSGWASGWRSAAWTQPGPEGRSGFRSGWTAGRRRAEPLTSISRYNVGARPTLRPYVFFCYRS